MDRNFEFRCSYLHSNMVALRKESVDRNGCRNVHGFNLCASLSARRAWIEIETRAVQNPYTMMSLSARRAWIEIRIALISIDVAGVALRKESVDRNLDCGVTLPPHQQSLSARRAWIEIKNIGRLLVAVRRRSPQGERG